MIPSGIDEQIVKSVKVFYRSHRFPVITWRDRKGNGTLLIRASCMINSRNVFQPFKKPNREFGLSSCFFNHCRAVFNERLRFDDSILSVINTIVVCHVSRTCFTVQKFLCNKLPISGWLQLFGTFLL